MDTNILKENIIKNGFEIAEIREWSLVLTKW